MKGVSNGKHTVNPVLPGEESSSGSTSRSTTGTGERPDSGRLGERVATRVQTPGAVLPTGRQGGRSVESSPVASRETGKKPSKQKPAQGPFDLAQQINKYFGNDDQSLGELFTCLDPLLETGEKPSIRKGGRGTIGQRFLTASVSQPVLREELLYDLKRDCLAFFASATRAKLEKLGVNKQQLIAVIWWCNLLAGTLDALSAMQVLPKARLCRMAQQICSARVFVRDAPYLNHRMALIYRHAAEHGDANALHWLLNRCLLDESTGLAGFSLDEGFRWLHIYRLLVTEGTLAAPEGDDLIARLVRDGRNLCQGRTDAPARERLLTVGLYLDYRFGPVDKNKAQALLTQVLAESAPQAQKVSPLSANWQAMTWLWRGILALPDPYSKAQAQPDARACFKKAERLGSRDAVIYRLQLDIRDSYLLPPEEAIQTLENIVIHPTLTKSEEELAPLPCWGLMDVIFHRFFKAAKLGDRYSLDLGKHCQYSQETKKRLLALWRTVDKGIHNSTCQGEPQVRAIWLARHLGPVYSDYHARVYGPHIVGDPGEESSEARQCRQLLELLQFTDVDSQLCVYQSAGNGVPYHFDRAVDPKSYEADKNSKKLARAIAIDPVKGPLTVALLSLPTYPFSYPELGRKVYGQLPDYTDFQLFWLMQLPGVDRAWKALANTARMTPIDKECQYRGQPSMENCVNLQNELLDVGREEQACQLWRVVPAARQQELPDDEKLLTGPEIKAGRYHCWPWQRDDKYELFSWEAPPPMRPGNSYNCHCPTPSNGYAHLCNAMLAIRWRPGRWCSESTIYSWYTVRCSVMTSSAP